MEESSKYFNKSSHENQKKSKVDGKIEAADAQMPCGTWSSAATFF